MKRTLHLPGGDIIEGGLPPSPAPPGPPDRPYLCIYALGWCVYVKGVKNQAVLVVTHTQQEQVGL